MKIDLGCSTLNRRIKNNTYNFIGVDIVDYGQEIIHDITKIPYPFKNNSVSLIYTRHCFENVIKTPQDIKKIFREWYRISKPNSIWVLVVPHWSRSYNAIQHNIGLNPDFIKYFTSERLIDNFDNLDLKVSKIKYNWRTRKFKFFSILWSWILNRSIYITEEFFNFSFGGIEEFSIIINVKSNFSREFKLENNIYY